METKNEEKLNEKTKQIIQDVIEEDALEQEQLFEEMLNEKNDQNGNKKFSKSK